mgnify:CR=1 FL=1
MTAMAARPLGVRTLVLDPDAACAAAGVADGVLVAPFEDATMARELGLRADVVSVELERIPVPSLAAAAAHAPLRPSAEVLGVIRDRAAQKRWLEGHGIPLGPWRAATDAATTRAAIAALGMPCRVKATVGGYDGRSQVRVTTAEEAASAWDALGAESVVVERELALASECSVLVARSPRGEVRVHPPARNWHEHGILVRSMLPSGLPEPIEARAIAIARELAASLGIEGLLVVECFVTEDGAVLVNELAPRPHNSFHHAGLACATSQFEQFVRAVGDLPLGDTTLVQPVALANLLGDLWRGDAPPPFARALAVPGVRIELYGKAPRPKRKVGHLMSAGRDAADALARLERKVAPGYRGFTTDFAPSVTLETTLP